MPLSDLKFDEVRMSFTNGEKHAERVERIVRLTFEFVRELLLRDVQHLGADANIAFLEVHPVLVSFETMSDERIAQLSAAEIHRAVLHALHQ